MAKERVFPIYLDGAVQSVAANADWNGETSRVLVTAAATVTVGDADVPGTLLSIGSTGTHTTTIDIPSNSPFGGDDGFDDITMNTNGECITLMWTGSEWFIMGGTEATELA